jgi:ABC-type Fe3+-hydroxamate transport system substrate-binding protein
MSDLNNLGINYIYTFDETFPGSANTGDVESIDQIFAMYRDMGENFGVSNKVDAYIAQQQAEMKSIQSKVAAAATGTPPTVQFIYYGGTAAEMYGDYTGSIIQQYVTMGGGKWVVPPNSVGGTSAESLIAENPDIIIVSSNPAGQTPFTQLPALQDMKAFKDHRVYVSDNLPWTSNSGGLFLADTAKQVAGYINPTIKF